MINPVMIFRFQHPIKIWLLIPPPPGVMCMGGGTTSTTIPADAAAPLIATFNYHALTHSLIPPPSLTPSLLLPFLLLPTVYMGLYTSIA